ALLASCGSSATRLSSSDFNTKMNAICKSEQKQTKFLDNTNIFNLDEGAKGFQKIKPIETDIVNQVEDLNPPKSEEAASDAWVKSIRDAIDSLDGLVSVAKAGKQKEYSQRLIKLFNETDGANKAISKYAK